ncbi:flagellar type III secretion system pore protein FliP [Methylobacterium sp. 1030]|uniref:flagellar type III secretion system pore protein FliP n=1 Tax=Methylobacterium sp. 1030 TaxID=3156404 RepID=UPI00339942F2
MTRRLLLVASLLIGVTLVGATAASAQTLNLEQVLPPGNGSASGRMIQLIALLTVLSLAPGLLVMMTSFTRFVVALSFLRSGLGLQSTPANLILISLSLFMTFYVMGPTFEQAWQNGVRPLTENKISEEEAFTKITDPFRAFMTAHVRPKDLQTFADLASVNLPKVADEDKAADGRKAGDKTGSKIDLRILIPAFMISELRRGFEIGFLIALPFLVIDMVVAVLIMSMGMMMMPPTVISLPFKVLFFILMDGWNMLASGLVRSYM